MLSQWAFGIYGTHLWWKWWLEEVILRWRWLMRVVGDVIVRWRSRWRRWLIRDLIVQWSFVPMLAEDFKVVSHLCEPRSLSVVVFSMSFSALHCGLSSHNGFMFLPGPFNLLLDSGKLLFLCCCYFFLSFIIPIISLDVVRLLFLQGWLMRISFSGLT
jgi:hypothetical protein